MQRRIVPDIIRGPQVLLELPADANVRSAARAMRDRKVGSVLITENGRLLGIFTERDLVCRVVACAKDPDSTPLGDVMTAEPDTIGPNASAIDALRLMDDAGYRHLPVVSEGRVIGIVSRRDFFGSEKARLESESDLWERL